MRDLGNEDVARLFAELAAAEASHLDTLIWRTEGVELPALPAHEYAWLDEGPPETAARELVFRLMTPRQALAIALSAEKRARDFFRGVRRLAADPALRALAQEMEMEEDRHIALVLDQMTRTPDPLPDWASVYSVN